MKVFKRENIKTHCVGQEWPEFLGSVQLGESFIIETEQYNLVNGPIAIREIKAGEDEKGARYRNAIQATE